MIPLEELDDSTKESKVGTGPVCCEIVRSLLQTRRVYIYTLVLIRLLVDHEYNINVPTPMSVSHPSSIRPFLIFRPCHHVFPNVSFSKHKIALLSNDDMLPTAGTFTECFEENFPPNGVLLPNSAHKLVSFLYQFLVLTIPNLRSRVSRPPIKGAGCYRPPSPCSSPSNRPFMPQ
jgi:hypothetical protein